MSGQSSSLPTGSGAFISGEPWAVGEMYNRTMGFPSMVNSVIQAALQEEQDRLQRKYEDRGIAAEVSVTFDEERMAFVYTATGDEAVSAEYGGPESGPQAILRKTALRSGNRLKGVLEKGMAK